MTKTRQTGTRAKPRQGQSVESTLKRPQEEAGKADNQIVAALSRGLSVIECFTRNDPSLGNAELAERTGLAKPTVSRLTYTLAVHNFLSFDPRTRGYRLGPAAVRLGAVAHVTTNVRTVALPFMRELAQGSHFNVGLGVRDGLHMIYSDTAEGNSLVGLRLFPGSRIPIDTTAMGRAYLAKADPVERTAVFEQLQSKSGSAWKKIKRGIERSADEIDRLGYCESIGEWHSDINAVAVPVFSVPDSQIHVLSLGGPAYALPEDDLREKWGPKLVEIARKVENALWTEDLTD